jgi:hypothetical protein
MPTRPEDLPEHEQAKIAAIRERTGTFKYEDTKTPEFAQPSKDDYQQPRAMFNQKVPDNSYDWAAKTGKAPSAEQTSVPYLNNTSNVEAKSSTQNSQDWAAKTGSAQSAPQQSTPGFSSAYGQSEDQNYSYSHDATPTQQPEELKH